MSATQPQTIYLKDYQPPGVDISQVELQIEIHDGYSLVHSSLTCRLADADGELRLDGEQLELLEILLDDRPLDEAQWQQDESGLSLSGLPEQFVLQTRVKIYPEQNTALEGLYHSGSMYCTQCEAEGFRKITFYPDRPDVLSRFTTRIEADKQRCPVLLSNGNPQASGDLADGRHFAVWNDPHPKPCYLFALVAGDLQKITDSHCTPSGRQIELNIYTEAENIGKCDHAMLSLINAMRWDEQVYGREYDLDVYNIVAVNDFNMGAMENKGLNVFNAKYVLASRETATDRDFQGIESVIAHEYFHNWTGNRITCRDWFQLSLKEGFTVYRDQCFSADMGSAGVKRIDDVRMLRVHQFAEDAGPMAHPVRPQSYIEINNFYTVTVYEKGAEVVRMQANLLGPENFRKATDLYFERFDGQAVTTEDFVDCMQQVSGRDLTQFKNWYDYAGTPLLKIAADYNADDAVYKLNIAQHCPDTPGQADKPAFHIPLQIGLLDGQGQDLLDNGLLELTQADQQFVFKDIRQKPVLSVLRGFSAPVKIDFAYSDAELMFLMANDTDGFARWDAAQSLYQRVLLGLVKDCQQSRSLTMDQAVIDAFRKALLAESSDKALIAEVLSLPSAGYLGELMDVVDVEAIYQARQTFKQQIATALREDLLMVYESCREQGDYQITANDIGRRSLKNTVLSYLAALTQDEEVRQLCLNQYGAGHNMTDVMAAFSLILDSEYAEREAIIADFEQHWQHDALVMDKWFTAQAVSHRQDTLDQVIRLTAHPQFSIKNPNKVRSLIGAFCSANPLRFHQADGSGYAFLVDYVLQLDQLNPQMAARMLRLLSRWKQFDQKRQDLIKNQLQRVVETQGISRDVYEIAEKSLQ